MTSKSYSEQVRFVQTIGPIIVEEAKKRGYHLASPVIAQACIESAFNGSSLAERYHNYFGLKCGTAWKGKSVNLSTKEEYQVGKLTTIKDNFRVYDTMEEGVAGYFDFINTKLYANLKFATSPRQYLEYIKSDGYATSSTYVTTNMNCIKKFNLTLYDWESNNIAEPLAEKPILKIGAKGDSVYYLQSRLSLTGYTVGKIDGIFGPQTYNAVIAFQAEHELATDGIVGPKTWEALG